MKTTRLEIIDQVNVKFHDLEAHVRRKITDALKFMVPYARHMPAFKLGRWDGKVSFSTAGGATYVNLLDRVLPIVIEAGYEVTIDDKREERDFQFPEVGEDFLADIMWPAGHPKAGEPIMLRDYQVEAIRNYLANPQSLQSISTGAGKTIMTATLSKLVEPHGRSIVIVPNKSLVEQTEEDYRNIGLDVGVFFGDRKEWNHKHTICTWQSLSIFWKKTRRDELEIGLDEFIDGVVCVMVDEAHTIKGQELRDLLCGAMAHVPIRWGLTGTIPKEDFEFLNLLVSIGPVVGEIKAADLQDKGVLANCHVSVLQTVDEVAYKTYHEEYEFLSSDKARLNWIAEQCTTISESGNTLILIDRIECGRYLQDLIPNSVFISGEVKSKDRKKEYKDVQVSDGKIIIATYGVAAVGINIPRIFNLVLIEAGKSFTRVIQSVGRGLRKAADKDFVQIYDICSTAKFTSKHLTKRKQYYRDAGYPFTITKVTYR